MDRRVFIRSGVLAAGASIISSSRLSADLPWSGAGGRASARLARRAELLLRGGVIYDGTGAAGVEADVRISGDRIAAVGRGLPADGARVIDVRGHAVAPGFIDIHAHTDLGLFAHPNAESKVRQGVTTEVAGQDGSSVAPSSEDRAANVRERYAEAAAVDVRTLGGFFSSLSARGAAVNLASMVGAGTIRGLVIGADDRPPTDAELARMVELVRRAVADGACGISSGLEYTPGGFASKAELAALAAPFAGTGLPYATHMRNEDDELLTAIEEALEVGRVAGVPVHISHLKAQGERNWWKAEPALRMLESVRAAGRDVTFDRYPYIAYSTGLSNLFPLWSRDGGTAAFLGRLRDPAQRPRIEAAVREKIAELGSWDAVQITSTSSESLAWARGERLGRLATERGQEPYALLLSIMIEDGARSGMVGFGMSEENTALMLAHPLGMICSDAPARAVTGPLSAGTPHPRAYGSFPRVLGFYVRERGTLTLEKAIHKMTGMPAARLRLEGRGRLETGAFADVVVFDPDTVIDRATFEAPHAYPVGIPYVIVNGELVIAEGEHTNARPGRVLTAKA
ncbi:MAG: N-acyl-D-amino-acid deacylase family protein [Longimicrobiales bacterium]